MTELKVTLPDRLARGDRVVLALERQRRVGEETFEDMQ